MKPVKTGINRILSAFANSFNGFKQTYKSEQAFRQDLFLCFFLSIATLFFSISIWQKGLLISSLLIILLAELINTAIETIIDRISDEYHELSKKAKDIGSLLVLVSFIYAAVIWFTVLYSQWIN